MLSTVAAHRIGCVGSRVGSRRHRLVMNPVLVLSNKYQQQRHQYNFSASNSLQDYYDEYRWIPSLLWRLTAAIGTVHLVSEYCIELTLCEGPSMYPTIRPYGEIILVDRLSPRLWGINGGCAGTDRAREARKRQDAWEEAQRRSSSAAAAAVDGAVTATTTDLYQWHEPRIPVNQLPPTGAWSRFWKQLTSGISVGDVVVVQHPDRRGTVCKRIVGLPGDLVVDPPSLEIRRNQNKRRIYQHGLLVIPDGHIWIEGDNPRNSADSRNYGPVPAALIVGRVACRVWPLRGSAMMQRGARPCPPDGAPFSGSTILPAGYEGEEIVKVSNEVLNKHRSNKNEGSSWMK